jgi:hypothetical protein
MREEWDSGGKFGEEYKRERADRGAYSLGNWEEESSSFHPESRMLVGEQND